MPAVENRVIETFRDRIRADPTVPDSVREVLVAAEWPSVESLKRAITQSSLETTT